MTGQPGWETFVLDASVAVEMVLVRSARSEAVSERLHSGRALASAVLPYEAANVLRRRRSAGMLSRAEAIRAHQLLLALPVELVPYEAVAERAWELGGNLSSYDASYVAVAERADATFITADARIARAPGVRCRIEVVDEGYPAYVSGLREASGS